MAESSQLLPLFSTSLLTEIWAQAPSQNAALHKAIVERHRATSGVQLSNVLGWQSDDGMLQWGGTASENLLSHIMSCCDAVTRDLDQGGGGRTFRWTANMWANLSRAGSSNQTHSHPGAFWSAIYYVDDGYNGSTDRALGGELVFLDPRMPMVRARTPDLRRRRAGGGYDSQESWLRPTTGRIVIFPSWVMHSVRPYHGPGNRISIALNLTPRYVTS